MESSQSLSNLLEKTRALRQEVIEHSQLANVVSQVKVFQNKRLSNTYQDLLEDSAYVSGARFFLDHLYGDHDWSHRDAQVARVLPKAEKILPTAGLEVLRKVLEMDYLAEHMDLIISRSIMKLGNTHEVILNDDLYLAAFRDAGEFPIRQRQVALIEQAGNSLAKLMRLPLLSGVLKMTHGAAQKANLEDFHKFLVLGVESFKQVKNPKTFFSIIRERETELLRRIFDEGISSFD